MHCLKDRLNKEIPETSHRSSDVFIAKDGKGYLIQSALNLLTASEILAVVGSSTGVSLTISLIPDQGVEVKMMYYNVSFQQLQKRFNLSTDSFYYVTQCRPRHDCQKILISVSSTQTYPLWATVAEPEEAFLMLGRPYNHKSN